ncbi:plasmid replication initiator protein [Streptomyces albiaxialis]|uniref:Plasmid replication initiator protein n=1 Tax=Streptomyces albiaxialis TaxID=329523 RepID=A0ABP5HRU3_9ACTN
MTEANRTAIPRERGPPQVNGKAARRSALATAERLRSLSLTERDILRVVQDPSFPRWREQIRSIGGCESPVYLTGHTTVRDRATGEVLRHYDTFGEPGGRLAVRCKNRRATRCAPCSRLHAGDTFQLIRSGLTGGKGVRPQVADHPRLFFTLTAPSFGAVHRAASGKPCRPRRDGGRCEHGRPVGCGQRHPDDDALVGKPLCRACYDYTAHVLWHAYAGRLWNRVCDGVRRRLATAVGITQSRLRRHARLSFAKVAEYQRRGAVHFHAVVRLDGPDGPQTPPPAWGTHELLTAAVRAAAASVSVTTAYSPATGEHVIRWGNQLDVHPIRSHTAFTHKDVTDDAVAAYVAKYISKSVADSAGGIDYRITEYTSIQLAPVDGHIRALMATCWRLGGLPEFSPLHLRTWTHTLGYRGHALTKSRHYSTTYEALRTERIIHSGGVSTDTNTPNSSIESAWRFAGSGYTMAEAEIAAGVLEEVTLSRKIAQEYGR